MPEKIDMFADLKALYRPPSKSPVLVEVPPLNYLMVDGSGAPGASGFQQAIEALYSAAYTLKFTLKLGPLATDFRIMPLDALWWAEDLSAFDQDRRDEWLWTLMIAVPDFVTPAMVTDAIAKVREKKDPPALTKLRLERLEERTCAQIMHIGPYSEEGPTRAKLFAFIAEKGYQPRGKHHEIYLSDPRRARPEKMRTVIRHPVS
ncbi:MAG: GyrI-like domain-containing protein [Armatimonadota bacterium]